MAKSTEQSVADNLEKGLNSLTFNSGLFARFITSNDIRVQTKVYDILIACIEVWAHRYDNDNYDSDEGMNLCAKSKRISEYLHPYQ